MLCNISTLKQLLQVYGNITIVELINILGGK